MSTYNDCRDHLEKLLSAIQMPEEMTGCILKEYQSLDKEPLLWDLPESDADVIPVRSGSGDDLLPGTAVITRQMAAAARNRLDGCWVRFPEEIYVETMKVFTRFVREYERSYGYCGFDRGFWTPRQVNARLFRLGQLEYELFDEDGIRRIGVHIPSTVVLEGALLNQSLENAHVFLNHYFPEWASYDFFCESWLLSGTLKELLPEGSRILKFQQAFNCEDLPEEADDCLEWVFHIAEGQKKSVSLANLKEETSLQRNLKRYLLSGGRLHNGAGVLARPFPE